MLTAPPTSCITAVWTCCSSARVPDAVSHISQLTNRPPLQWLWREALLLRQGAWMEDVWGVCTTQLMLTLTSDWTVA